TMTNVKAPLVRSNDQCLPRIRWVQTGYLKFSAKVYEEASKVESCPSEIILDDLLELDSLVRYDFE
nr:hypothetical protein [Tanacetum cinerariifolium]